MGVLMWTAEYQLAPVKWFLLWIPWPTGSEAKLMACARCRFTDQLKIITGMQDLEEDWKRQARRAAIEAHWRMIPKPCWATSRAEALAIVKSCHERKGDLDF